jgi:hypothetical protein
MSAIVITTALKINKFILSSVKSVPQAPLGSLKGE